MKEKGPPRTDLMDREPNSRQETKREDRNRTGIRRLIRLRLRCLEQCLTLQSGLR